MVLDGVTFEVIVHRIQDRNEARGGPWLVRVYQGDDHVHSAEGGVSLTGGLDEARRAMLKWCSDAVTEANTPADERNAG